MFIGENHAQELSQDSILPWGRIYYPRKHRGFVASMTLIHILAQLLSITCLPCLVFLFLFFHEMLWAEVV